MEADLGRNSWKNILSVRIRDHEHVCWSGADSPEATSTVARLVCHNSKALSLKLFNSTQASGYWALAAIFPELLVFTASLTRGRSQ